MTLSEFFSPPRSPETEAAPTTMKGNEPWLGLAVAAIILVVAVLDLTVTTGSGAPKHPETWPPLVGIGLSVLLAVSLRWRSRLISPFVAIFAAYFVEVAKGPKSLGIAHAAALAAAVGFALMLTLRHRSEQKALGSAGGAAARRAAADARRRRRKGEPEPTATVRRPPPSARYTPPKSAAPAKSGRWAASKAAAASKSAPAAKSSASSKSGPKPKR